MARNGARCHHSSRVQPNTGTDASPRHWRSGPSGGRKGTTISYTGPDAYADTGPDADTDARTISQIDSEHDIRIPGLDDTGDGTGLSEVRVCHGDDDGRGRPDDVELYICGRKRQL